MITADVVSKEALAPEVRHLTLCLRDAPTFTFRPGQFLQFVLDEKTLRQFSFASPPSRLPEVELCVDVSPRGRGSRFVEGLRVGDRVSVRGPFGVFTVPPAESRPLEFVATGAGIAPIRSMIHANFAADSGHPPAQPVTLTFGNRDVGGLFYLPEWERLAGQRRSFRYVPTLTQPPPEWTGARGRVTDLLRARNDLPGRAFFFCGSPGMVDDCRKIMAAKGVPEADVHFEKFY